VVCLLIEGLHALRSVETPVFWVLESGGGRPRSLLPTRPTAALTCRNRPTLAPRATNPSYQGCRRHATPAPRQQDAAPYTNVGRFAAADDHSETEAIIATVEAETKLLPAPGAGCAVADAANGRISAGCPPSWVAEDGRGGVSVLTSIAMAALRLARASVDRRRGGAPRKRRTPRRFAMRIDP
jgi:hypothetical protein